MIKRHLQDNIEPWLFKNYVIVIYGARQVGKTTLCKQILEKFSQNKKTGYFDCEMLGIRNSFETTNADELQKVIGDYELIVLDEAQLIKDIGKTLKVICDHIPSVQVIATGSSSFDLANQLSEPMTGRALTFMMYPFSIWEINKNADYITANAAIENFLLTGSYPKIYSKPKDESIKLLDWLSGNYLYKDILTYEGVKNSSQLVELLQLLSLQIGQEVSLNEIGTQLGMNHNTVKKYIDLLEKSFVIFKLRAFSRNPRKEIAKSIKVYFYDLGIRNCLIQSFAPINLRNDVGGLWENFCIAQRKQTNQANNSIVNSYFYRTYGGQEIDYIEEIDGQLHGFEFKYKKPSAKTPSAFLEEYKNADFKVINKQNWSEFLL
jgi:predicted AAA+ superfamily ATPase